MRCEICAISDIRDCAFVVVLSRWRGGWLFSRHRARSTWETQGGHIEPGETPEMAARRELYEESGATDYTLRPLCGYWTSRDGAPPRYGMVFLADIHALGPLPESEIAQVQVFPNLPDALTYPDITPRLFAHALKKLPEAMP